MNNTTSRTALIGAALLFTGAVNLKAQENFDLPAITAGDIEVAAISDPSASDPKCLIDLARKPRLPLAQKEWTVMVFMNAKNDLNDSHLLGLVGKFAKKDLKEMKQVGTTGAVNVVVEYGSKGKGAKRLMVQKDGIFSDGEAVYGEYPDADMGDYRRVIEFVNWSKTNFPARKYMLVLWNHGLGWIDPNQTLPGTGSADKGILFDDETKNYVRTRQLGDILRATGYVDVLTMNACLMQMAEIAYEVKDNTGLILGSEETMLAQGFDYVKLLNFMNADPAFTNEQLGAFLMNWYREFYAGGMDIGPFTLPLTNGATLSTVRPQAVNGLPERLNAFATAVMRNNETAAVKTAIRTVVRFASLAGPQDREKLIAPYVDLYDFAAIIGTNASSQETKQTAESLMTYIKTDLVMHNTGFNTDAVNGYDYSRVGGIAINMTMKAKVIPPQLADIHETDYSELGLSQASIWDEFVTWTDLVWQNS